MIRFLLFASSRYFFEIATIAVLFTFANRALALVAPFTEDFSEDASGWVSDGTNAIVWHRDGGVENQPFISTTATVSAACNIVFRGNSANDASDGAFAGNWLAGGVTAFRAYVRHDAPMPLNFFVRLNAGGMGYAASSNPIEVKPHEWVLISIPIVDSLGPTGIWQSYEGAGLKFSSVFTSIKDVQVGLDAAQPTETMGHAYHVSLAYVSMAILQFTQCQKAEPQQQ